MLWIDAHPDVMTPEVFTNAHAMVLGNLLGQGDKEFTGLVKQPVKPQNVLIAGLGATLPFEAAFIDKHKIQTLPPQIVNESSDQVINWIKANNITKLAIHFDLDVMSPTEFRSLYFTNPFAKANQFDGITQGEMKIASVQRLILDAASVTDVVGLGITEFFPWDAINLANMLASLPLLKE